MYILCLPYKTVCSFDTYGTAYTNYGVWYVDEIPYSTAAIAWLHAIPSYTGQYHQVTHYALFVNVQ